MIEIASFLLGAVIGLIAVSIFAVILKRYGKRNAAEAIEALKKLTYLVLGGGTGDFVVFDLMLKSGGAIVFYVLGFAATFLLFGVPVYLDWRRKP